MSAHLCPAGCQRHVAHHHFACREDWYRLPQPYRDEIRRWHEVDAVRHAAAMAAARRWYDEHADAVVRRPGPARREGEQP